jgi:hypothetical protein
MLTGTATGAKGAVNKLMNISPSGAEPEGDTQLWLPQKCKQISSQFAVRADLAEMRAPHAL